MGKAPAFQFYIKDWLSDPQLRMASFSTKGIWIDLLCYMWGAPVRGKVEGSKEELSRLLGANGPEFDLFLDQAKTLAFCNVSVTRNGTLQICNRRMFREENTRKSNKDRQQRYRDKQDNDPRNAKVTPPSPSPSPSTPTKKKRVKAKKSTFGPDNNFELFWQAYPKKVKKQRALRAWQKQKIPPKTLPAIIKAIKKQDQSDEWIKDDGQFIPHPSTWLNDRRWEDETEHEMSRMYSQAKDYLAKGEKHFVKFCKLNNLNESEVIKWIQSRSK